MFSTKQENGIKTLGAALGSKSPTQGKGEQSSLPAAPVGANRPTKKTTDPNMTDGRLLVNRRCIYERQLPGNAYITAHAERLQHGYFNSKNTSDPEIPHVDFLGVNFVLHPGDCNKHRFKAATIKASVQNFPMGPSNENPYPYPQENPKFLMHAPHLIYGAVSPETLQWTFSLAGSLGISESPVSASVTPSGSRSTSYKIYEMMKIQGSCRTLRSPDGPEFDVEDGEIVWSLSENSLQRSGLPREFTFVMLVQKPSADSRVHFKLEIEPMVDAWYGSYPTWWINRPTYQPLPKRAVNFRNEFGQHFTPADSDKGFNFATLANSLDDYVNMPGSTYSSNVAPDGVYNDPTGTGGSNTSQPSKPSGGSNNNNSQPIYIPEYPGYPQYPSSQPIYYPPISSAGRAWETNSPFQRGWPRGDPFYGGPSGSSGSNTENTINVRILLDNNFASQIAATTLGVPMRHASPLLKGPPTQPLNTSPQSNGRLSGRAKSLRRTRSSERLNRLSSSPHSTGDTDPSKEDAHERMQSADTGTTRKASNGVDYSIESVDPATYEINHTPPPDSIRDPGIVNGHGLKTSSRVLNYDEASNGLHTTTPPSNGLRDRRTALANGYMPRRSASLSQNGAQNRYSYPSASVNH